MSPSQHLPRVRVPLRSYCSASAIALLSVASSGCPQGDRQGGPSAGGDGPYATGVSGYEASYRAVGTYATGPSAVGVRPPDAVLASVDLGDCDAWMFVRLGPRCVLSGVWSSRRPGGEADPVVTDRSGTWHGGPFRLDPGQTCIVHAGDQDIALRVSTGVGGIDLARQIEFDLGGSLLRPDGQDTGVAVAFHFAAPLTGSSHGATGCHARPSGDSPR